MKSSYNESINTTSQDETSVQIFHDREQSADIDDIKTYMHAIGRVALLDAAQEVDLSKSIEAGLYAQHLLETAVSNGEHLPIRERRDLTMVAREGKTAKDHITEANLRLVVSIAKRYMGKGLEFGDLIQHGNMGLMRAVEKFDYEKGFKFSTYATWWIRQAITRGIGGEARNIRLPIHLYERVGKLKRVERDLRQVLEREATDEELCDSLGIDLKDLLKLKKYKSGTASLDMPVGDDGDGALMNFVVDTDEPDVDDIVQHLDLQRGVNNFVERSLSGRELQVIKMRSGLYNGRRMTLDEIAAKTPNTTTGAGHITRERVRQIEIAAMGKLRNLAQGDDRLKSFLEQ